MELSDDGLQFIKDREDTKLTAYQDIAGIWTIGTGSIWIDGRRVKQGDTITEEKALYLLNQELSPLPELIDNLVVPTLTKGEADALISFTFNLGLPAFKSSSLRSIINRTAIINKLKPKEYLVTPNSDELGRIKNAFLVWCKYHNSDGKLVTSEGLRNRRMAEWRLFIS